MIRDKPPLSVVARELLAWAADDFTEVFVVRDVLKRLVGTLAPDEERAAALETLTELVSARLVEVGDMRGDAPGLVYWGDSPVEVMGRLGRIWSASEPPKMGEGPWLAATESGRERLKTDP